MNVNGRLLESDVVSEDEHCPLFPIEFLIRMEEVLVTELQSFRLTEMSIYISMDLVCIM